MKDYVKFEEVKVDAEEVINCSFSKWAKLFPKNLFPYRVIEALPDEFIKYLLSDGVRLPWENNEVELDRNSENEYSDWEGETEGEGAEGKGADLEEAYLEEADLEEAYLEEADLEEADLEGGLGFSELSGKITQHIHDLGGKVLPKLNWSSPKDASWLMPGNTMQCSKVDDVFLLLKSSDHIVDDLAYSFSEVKQEQSTEVEDKVSCELEVKDKVCYELVLKQWQDINPALEFRVFIRDEKILGVSQRDLNHYEFLKDLKEELKEVIETFVDDKIITTLRSSKNSLSKCIVDLYLPRPFDQTFIIDINPFSRKTDSLLFTWNELLLIDPSLLGKNSFELRLIDQTNIGAFAKKQYSESQVPIDVIGATHDSEALVELAREWQKLQLSSEAR